VKKLLENVGESEKTGFLKEWESIDFCPKSAILNEKGTPQQCGCLLVALVRSLPEFDHKGRLYFCFLQEYLKRASASISKLTIAMPSIAFS